ncbi:MAG: T9SS type A sorting domain-containing protein [Flavobacteriia bacterium]|nr:T9SS type A sorting domain-containing protein [Flavobacteriia bacterium]
MKKMYFLSALAFGATFNLLAQPTLTATSINPTVGESFTVYNCAYISPGSAGSNVTFDLSGLSQSSATTLDYAAGNASYPGSNLTATFTSGAQSNNIYMNASASGLTYVGMLAGPTSFQYQDAMELNYYPLTYNSTNSDYFHATFTSGVAWERFGTITAEADAYGTLITPEGTFTNVMRVHYSQDYKDSCSITEVTYLSDVYVWYKDGFHNELASVSSLTTSQGSTTQYAGYLETAGLGLTEEENVALSVYPNPATDLATIRLKANESMKALTVTDMNGRVIDVSYTSNTNGLSLDVSSLDAGLYLIELHYESGEIGLGKVQVK